MTIRKYMAALSVAALFFCAQAPAQAPALHVPDTANYLRVEGGKPDAMVGVFLGLEKARFQLPGNAWVLLNPVATYVLGRFEPNGVYEVPLHYEGAPVEEIRFLMQAVSVDDDQKFYVSGLRHLFFDGVREVHIDAH